jgi:hypothetical protein
MRHIPETELKARIHAFLDKKMNEFPDVQKETK